MEPLVSKEAGHTRRPSYMYCLYDYDPFAYLLEDKDDNMGGRGRGRGKGGSRRGRARVRTLADARKDRLEANHAEEDQEGR